MEKWPVLGQENEVLLELSLKDAEDPAPCPETGAGFQPQDGNRGQGSEARKWVGSGHGQNMTKGVPFSSLQCWALCRCDLGSRSHSGRPGAGAGE